MSGDHRRSARGTTRAAIAVSAVLALAAAVAIIWVSTHRSAPHPAAAPPTTVVPTTGVVPAASTTAPPTTAPPTTAASTTIPSTGASHVGSTALAALLREDSATSSSVAALDVTTGVSTVAGAGTGMTTASIAKLQLLESLLLQHQRSGTALTDDEEDTVESMIEDSSNDAANSIFYDIGDRDDYVALERPLGLSATTTVPGSGDYWGLTRTAAAQELILLRNLVDAGSPLTAANRAYILNLMRHVEADQAWGVTAAASAGTKPAVKNGWLAVDSDDDRWAVNSLGVITVGQDTVLVAVMTQHGASYASGISRVETLAKAAVEAVTG